MIADMLNPSYCLRRERRNLPFVSLVIDLLSLRMGVEQIFPRAHRGTCTYVGNLAV
jgi:hypothetical protein